MGILALLYKLTPKSGEPITEEWTTSVTESIAACFPLDQPGLIRTKDGWTLGPARGELVPARTMPAGITAATGIDPRTPGTGQARLYNTNGRLASTAVDVRSWYPSATAGDAFVYLALRGGKYEVITEACVTESAGATAPGTSNPPAPAPVPEPTPGTSEDPTWSVKPSAVPAIGDSKVNPRADDWEWREY